MINNFERTKYAAEGANGGANGGANPSVTGQADPKRKLELERIRSFQARLKTEKAKGLVEKIFSTSESLKSKIEMSSVLCGYPSSVADLIRQPFDPNFPVGNVGDAEIKDFFNAKRIIIQRITKIIYPSELSTIMLEEAIAYIESRPDLYKKPQLKKDIILALKNNKQKYFPGAITEVVEEERARVKEHNPYEAIDISFHKWVNKILSGGSYSSVGLIAMSRVPGAITDASISGLAKEAVSDLRHLFTEYGLDRNIVQPERVFNETLHRWEKLIDDGVADLVKSSVEHDHLNDSPEIIEGRIAKIKVILTQIIREATQPAENF